MFIFILASISDGIKTEDPFWRKLLANSNQTSVALCATRGFSLWDLTAKKWWKNIELAAEESIQLD